MISVKNLKKTYSPGTRAAEEVLHGVSFDLPETGFVCILGRSGSGKTSLLNAIGGLDVFSAGTVEIDGARISRGNTAEMERQRNANFGYVFQNYYLLPEHSAAYNVYLGLHSLDLGEREKLKRVEDALRKVDMLRFRKRLVGELSGGQQQRIAIARAIAKAPKVIFADEPTGNLDEESTLNICSLLKRLSKTGLVVMVTHEERLANFYADRIIRIDDGKIASDSTEWERSEIIAADKNTVYSEDYRDEAFSSDSLNIRVLSAEGAEPAAITLIVEEGRLIIKSDDKRLIMHSKPSDPPYVREGSRPKVDLSQIDKALLDEAETARPPMKPRSRSGLGFKTLVSEMRTTASKKRLRNAATALFIILLSAMLLFSASDVNSVVRIDPEEFITADSHVVELQFNKGQTYDDKTAWSISEYIPGFLDKLEAKGLDYDYVPDTNLRFMFYCDILPQYGTLKMSLGKYNMVDIKRLDPSSLVYGRMPERYDEIVVDRWVIKNCTDKDGIVQNLIPDSEYMVGKMVFMDKKDYYPTIVGICDSGEPSIYMTKAGMLSAGIHGIHVMPYSEFTAVTGLTDLAPLEDGECMLVEENCGRYYLSQIGSSLRMTNGIELYFREAVGGVGYGSHRILAQIVVSDEYVEKLYRYMIETITHFDIWCADKAAVKKALNETLADGYEGTMLLDVNDTYNVEYTSFMTARTTRIQTRIIIFAAIGLVCLVMLYVIQRFRVRDRIGMIAVNRMLGIPGRDSMGVFIFENILLALKYSVPTVFLAWGVVTLLPILEVGGLNISIPLWVPFATVAAIVIAEVVVAMLAVLRLLKLPPAKLAAKYDF
ncbi:MAG: ATP-binding cassette domain-containing protein [Clostridia bacterium]|nr:ATP-binding cassette domain-containing protein [Clostridia bacterium]